MSRPRPFIERALAGDVSDLREIEDDVKRWHESDSKASLHAWLGMTHAEYRLWLERPAVLAYIVQARKYAIPLAQHLASLESSRSAPRVAARAQRKEVGNLVKWLKSTGRLRAGARTKKRA